MKLSSALLLSAGLMATASATQAKQVMCVFDLVGKSGDVYTLMKDYISLLLKVGVLILNYVSIKMKQ